MKLDNQAFEDACKIKAKKILCFSLWGGQERFYISKDLGTPFIKFLPAIEVQNIVFNLIHEPDLLIKTSRGHINEVIFFLKIICRKKHASLIEKEWEYEKFDIDYYLLTEEEYDEKLYKESP